MNQFFKQLVIKQHGMNGIHLEKIFNSSTVKGFPVTPAVRTSFILET